MYACIHLAPAGPPLAEGADELLLLLARRFAPEVEATAPGTVVLDIAPLRRLFGDAAKIASEIAREAHKMKLAGNIAVAATPDSAILAARNLRGVSILAPGEASDALANLRLTALPAGPEVIEVLQRWGVQTVGQFCELPIDGVIERLGQAGVELLRLARGERMRPLRLDRPAASYSARAEFEDPVALLDALMATVARLADELCGRLSSQAMAASEVRLRLELENRSTHARALQLPFPTRDPRSLVNLLRLELEAHPAAAAVTAAALEFVPTPARAVQHDFHAPPAPEAEKLQVTLDKIRGLVGEENAGSPRLTGTHRRDAWTMLATPPGATRVLARAPLGRMRLAFRCWRPPEPAWVEVEDGMPRRVESRRVRGVVLVAAGPWRSSGDWWTRGEWDREEWDVSLASGTLHRVTRLMAAREWVLEGAYD